MRIALAWCAAALFAAATARADDEPVPPELAALRRHCLESIETGAVPLERRWIESLGALERDRAAAGDYDGAQRAASLGESLATQAAEKADVRPRVSLGAAEVKTKGSGLSDAPGTLRFLKSGATAEWEVRGNFSGWYEVRLVCAVNGRHVVSQAEALGREGERRERKDDDSSQEQAPRTGGILQFSRVGGLGATAAPLRYALGGTGGWNLFETIPIGRMVLSNGPVRLRILVEKAAAEGLMNLSRIDLVPVSGPKSAGDDEPDALAAARSTYLKSYAERAKAATERYRKDLPAIEALYDRMKDSDGVARVRQERARVAAAVTPDLVAGGDAGGGSRTITLTVGDALGCQWRGDCRLNSTKDTLSGLRPAGTASVTWKLRAYGVPSGRYAVRIPARVGVLGGGKAELQVLGPGGAPLDKPVKVDVEPVQSANDRVKSEAAEKNGDDSYYPPQPQRREIEPGYLTIPKTAEAIVLRVTELTHEDGTLLDLKRLELRPAP